MLKAPGNIAILSNTSWSVYNFRRGLIRQLLQRGARVVVIAPEDKFSRKLQAMGCIFEPAPVMNYSLNPLDCLRYMLVAYRLMKKWRIDYALSFTIKPNIFGQLAARLLGIPALAVITGLGHLFTSHSWKTWAAIRLYRLGLRRAARAWFLNRDDRDFFLDKRIIRPGQAGLLPGEGVDTDYFSPAPSPGPPGRPFRFLFAGRLMKEKGIFEYVEAARLLRAAGCRARFLVAGFIEEHFPNAVRISELQQWQAQGLIEYVGAHEDIRPFLARADAVVLPTYYREGVPRILLEAASMGRPIVATDNVGCREIVLEGYNGYLCEKKQAEGLAEKMRLLLELPGSARLQMGLAGRQLVLERFDEKYIIGQYLEQLGLGVESPEKEEPACPVVPVGC